VSLLSVDGWHREQESTWAHTTDPECVMKRPGTKQRPFQTNTAFRKHFPIPTLSACPTRETLRKAYGVWEEKWRAATNESWPAATARADEEGICEHRLCRLSTGWLPCGPFVLFGEKGQFS